MMIMILSFTWEISARRIALTLDPTLISFFDLNHLIFSSLVVHIHIKMKFEDTNKKIQNIIYFYLPILKKLKNLKTFLKDNILFDCSYEQITIIKIIGKKTIYLMRKRLENNEVY